jgi:hypothetical protein
VRTRFQRGRRARHMVRRKSASMRPRSRYAAAPVATGRARSVGRGKTETVFYCRFHCSSSYCFSRRIQQDACIVAVVLLLDPCGRRCSQCSHHIRASTHPQFRVSCFNCRPPRQRIILTANFNHSTSHIAVILSNCSIHKKH